MHQYRLGTKWVESSFVGKGPGDAGVQHTDCELRGKIPGQGTAETLVSVVCSDRIGGYKEKYGISAQTKEKTFSYYCKGGQTLAQDAQSGCRVSVFGCSMPSWTQP